MARFATLRAWLSARSAPRARGPQLKEGVLAPKGKRLVDQDSPESLSAQHGLSSLSRALRHDDPETRARAVAIVAELIDVGAGALLKTMIHDPNADVRRAVARAAARVATTDVVASLIVALEDPDAGVRAEAASALARVTGCEVDPNASAEQIANVKRLWKERRYIELVQKLRSHPPRPLQ